MVTGQHDFFDDLDLHVVYLFYDETSETLMRNMAQTLISQYFGLIGVVLVNR